MVRSKGTFSGFAARSAPVASVRLIGAVTASLMLALCICAGLTLLTFSSCLAMPLPH